ncbi:p21-C-terminal region-binding protein-domain-containing protein [Amylocystis lapponica]|nr:p21-C-terminal region-binding protein-domain-containing protein [Amylocystis lapponica]
MAKRKQRADQMDDDDGGEDSDRSLVDVDFDFFDPNPDVDYLALKRLLAQLFQTDAELLETTDLADLILSQPLVGTTVKCDGRESDPYAFLTALNLHVHQTRPSVKALIEYTLAKAAPEPSFYAALQGLIGPPALTSTNHIGFIFSERLINMPVQVVPHMYRMLANEIQWALDENEPYNFTHFLFLSRIYRLSPEEEAEMQAPVPRTKRRKQAVAAPPSGVYPFHPEDELIRRVATHALDYSFTNVQPREKDAFGLDMGGRMMLVPADRLRELVAMLSEAYAAPS